MIKINEYPEKGSPDYSHLQPIVDWLLEHGNELAYDFMWGNDRTGYFCHLKKDIDFDGLESNFEFPQSLKIDRDKQMIDCFNTYSVIKKVEDF